MEASLLTFTDELIADLRRDEGVIPWVYNDSEGYATIGCGRLIDKRKGGRLSDDEIDYLLQNDINRSIAQCLQLSYWNDLTDNRKRAVVNAVFNLGFFGFMKFVRFNEFMKSKDYENASKELLSSKWASQVGDRAIRLANLIEKG